MAEDYCRNLLGEMKGLKMKIKEHLAIELLDAIKAATEAEKSFKADRGTAREYASHCAMLEAKASLERLLRNDCNVEPELLLRVLL